MNVWRRSSRATASGNGAFQCSKKSRTVSIGSSVIANTGTLRSRENAITSGRELLHGPQYVAQNSSRRGVPSPSEAGTVPRNAFTDSGGALPSGLGGSGSDGNLAG